MFRSGAAEVAKNTSRSFNGPSENPPIAGGPRRPAPGPPRRPRKSWVTPSSAKRQQIIDPHRPEGTTVRQRLARMLDMTGRRFKQAVKQRLPDRDQAWRDGVDVVAMDGFIGFKTAAREEVPGAVALLGRVNVVRLAGRNDRWGYTGVVPELMRRIVLWIPTC